MDNNLFVNGIKIDKDKIDWINKYPFNIECINGISELKFNKPVTFLVGENGVGKSTFIEELAIKLGLNPEGGTQNFTFKTKNTHSNLYKYLRIYSHGNKPVTNFFLRAESFYNFSSEVQRFVEEDYY